MKYRKPIYFLDDWRHAWLLKSLSWFQKWIYNGYKALEGYENIKVIPENKDDDDNAFQSATKSALELIQQNDPRRYAILEHEIHHIVETRATAAANYVRTGRVCQMNSRYLHLRDRIDRREGYIACYAATLVLEATHGRLYSLYFPYTRATRVRIERICCAEAKRFASRLSSSRYNLTIAANQFNEADYQFHWNANPWQRLRDIIARYRE